MSHSVTITRTVTSSNTTSTLILNTGYLKTIPGLLKLLQLILGAVCIGIAAWNHGRYSYIVPDLFFLLMTTSFLIGTFCLLVSCLFSLSTGGIISKTIYELIYHAVATILLTAASIVLLVDLNKYSSHYPHYNEYMAAAIINLVNAAVYLVMAVLARRSYRGI